MPTLAIFGHLGGWEILLLAVLGLLIFGRRLPEVGKSLGKGIVEFKKGLQGVEDEIGKAGDEKDKQDEHARLEQSAASHPVDDDIEHEPATNTQDEKHQQSV